jgi:hypothetical protein
LVLAATILGSGMAFIDESAVTVALLIEGKKKLEEQSDDPETKVLAA